MGKEWVEMVQALPAVHLTDQADAGSYSYKYASLPSILEAIKPVLADHGWCITQDVTTSDGGQPQVTTIFDHTEAESRVYGPLTVPAAGAGAQAVGSAITYARRYALVAALGLAPDGDDDGHAASKPGKRPGTPRDRAWAAIYDSATAAGTNPTELWFDTLEELGLSPDDVADDETAGRVIAAAQLADGYGE